MSYVKGLQDVGNGCYAYLQPDGGWGWSNAGLVVDGERTLLIDTLFDLELTGEMLRAMRDAVPAAARIDTLVNTHANGDHCYGNQLLAGARMVASEQRGRRDGRAAARGDGRARRAGAADGRARRVLLGAASARSRSTASS